MSPVVTGALVGVVLGAVALQLGFWGFVLAVVFGAIGALVAAIAGGRIDGGALRDVFSGRRSSR